MGTLCKGLFIKRARGGGGGDNKLLLSLIHVSNAGFIIALYFLFLLGFISLVLLCDILYDWTAEA